MPKIDPEKLEAVLNDDGILAEVEESNMVSNWTEYLMISGAENDLCLTIERNQILGEVEYDEDGEQIEVEESNGEAVFKEQGGYYIGYRHEQDESYGECFFEEITDEVYKWLEKTSFTDKDLLQICKTSANGQQ